MQNSALYYGGPIRTMEESCPVARALLVRDGTIRVIGSLEEARALAGDVPCVDLHGCALLPAFIDTHSHFSGVANAFLQVPLEEAVSQDEIGERIDAFLREEAPAPDEWVLARGYDHNALPGGHHPDKAFLEKLAPDRKIVLQHRSGHSGVFSPAALAALGIGPDTSSPAGGRIDFAAGYLEETAYMNAVQRLPLPAPERLAEAFAKAQQKYAAHGIATVQEGMMTASMAPPYRDLLDRRALFLDVVGYADLAAADTLKADFPDSVGRYDRHFRLGGLKIFLDGSPQARTAWMLAPYEGEEEYCGQGTMTDEAVRAAVRRAVREHTQLLAHCNGDAAARQYFDALAAVLPEAPGLPALRPVMIHAQLVQPCQLDRAAELGVIPSFFAAHVFHWGDVHIRNFGACRAAQISPAASALERDIPFTLHQDSPVIEPDMLETVWCAVTRRTKQGVLLGPGEAVGVYDALRGVTANAARQYFEEESKGTLCVGKRADLVMLSADPMAVPSEELRCVRVLATVKDGVPVYTTAWPG